MTKPLHVMMICFILMMVPLTGCLGDPEVEPYEVSVIEGCMTNTSVNYNPNATQEDGSCMDLLPKDALIELYESWGVHMFTPIMDQEDPRTGVEFSTKSMFVDWINTVDTDNMPDTKKKCEDAGGKWVTNAQGYSICHMRLDEKPEELAKFTTTSLSVIKDGSGALMLTSYDSTGTSELQGQKDSGGNDTVCTCPDGTRIEIQDATLSCDEMALDWRCAQRDDNNPRIETVSKQIVRLDSDIIVQTNGLGYSILEDGTYVRDGVNTRTTDSRDLMELILEESQPLRGQGQGGGGGGWNGSPCTCPDGSTVYLDFCCGNNCGNTDMSSHCSTPTFGDSGWTDSPLDVLFEINPDVEGFDFLDEKLLEAKIDYDSNADGITFTYNFENDNIGFKITVDSINHKLIAFESISVTYDYDSISTDRITLNYILETESETEDGTKEDVMIRAAPSGTHLHPWLDSEIREDWGYYHFCGCSCHPSEGLYVYMLYMTAATNIPIICNNACAAACDVSSGPNFPHIDADLIKGTGVKSGSITADVTEFINSKEMGPVSLALDFKCVQDDENSETVPLESIQNGVDDCSTSADEEFDSENGVTFVVSEKQIRNPSITSMGVQFMTMTEDGASVIEVMNFTTSFIKEGGDESARSTESGGGESGDDNNSEREVVYTDVDGDGKISPGDFISITFPHYEFIQFVDHSSGVTVAINGEEDTTAVLFRVMTCQEEFGDDVCESTVRFYDSNLGMGHDLRMCFLKPSGEDCNGNPISDS